MQKVRYVCQCKRGERPDGGYIYIERERKREREIEKEGEEANCTLSCEVTVEGSNSIRIRADSM